MEEEAYIEKDWLSVENYQFKILVMCAVLAENHLAYRGRLKDMCDFLGVSDQKNNKDRIKEAIEALEANGDIKTVRQGYVWTLTLSTTTERKARIITIKKKWIQLIQNYKAEVPREKVAWENVLRVLVYLCADNKDVMTYQEIANDLNISIETVKRCVKALDTINFNDMALRRRMKYYKKNDKYFLKGQEIDIMLKFE